MVARSGNASAPRNSAPGAPGTAEGVTAVDAPLRSRTVRVPRDSEADTSSSLDALGPPSSFFSILPALDGLHGTDERVDDEFLAAVSSGLCFGSRSFRPWGVARRPSGRPAAT